MTNLTMILEHFCNDLDQTLELTNNSAIEIDFQKSVVVGIECFGIRIGIDFCSSIHESTNSTYSINVIFMNNLLITPD